MSSTVSQISLRRVSLPLTGIVVLQVKFKTVMPDPTHHGFLFFRLDLVLGRLLAQLFKHHNCRVKNIDLAIYCQYKNTTKRKSQRNRWPSIASINASGHGRFP